MRVTRTKFYRNRHLVLTFTDFLPFFCLWLFVLLKNRARNANNLTSSSPGCPLSLHRIPRPLHQTRHFRSVSFQPFSVFASSSLRARVLSCTTTAILLVLPCLYSSNKGKFVHHWTSFQTWMCPIFQQFSNSSFQPFVLFLCNALLYHIALKCKQTNILLCLSCSASNTSLSFCSTWVFLSFPFLALFSLAALVPMRQNFLLLLLSLPFTNTFRVSSPGPTEQSIFSWHVLYFSISFRCLCHSFRFLFGRDASKLNLRIVLPRRSYLLYYT